MPLAGPLYLTQGPNPVLIAAWLTESRISHEAREPGLVEFLVQVSRVSNRLRKLARTKAQKLEVQADSACVSAASFRAELGGQLSSYAPSIGCALLDEAALAAAAGRLAELESTVFSSAPTTFWSLPRAWWKLHFQLPCSMSRGASFSFKHRFTLFRRRAIHAASETGFLVRALAGKVRKANSGKLKKAMCRQASCRLASSRRPETNFQSRSLPAKSFGQA